MTMYCPNCGGAMSLDRTDVNYAPNGVSYDRYSYHCHADDHWITYEIPRE